MNCQRRGCTHERCETPGCGHPSCLHYAALLSTTGVSCDGDNETCACTSFMREGGEIWSLEHAAEATLGAQQDGPALLVNVHPADRCAGRPCCLHNPSDHPLRDAPLNWRGDRGIMERLCAHGIGHPDPDDAAYRATQGDDDTVHGCDGCCGA